MPASYDLGLETERAALEKLEKQIIQQEQVTIRLYKALIKVEMTGINNGAVVCYFYPPDCESS